MPMQERVLSVVREKLAAGAAARKVGGRIARKVLVTSGILGTGATLAGAASAAKEEAKRPLAPPNALPPGY